jgi:hypothetical protein
MVREGQMRQTTCSRHAHAPPWQQVAKKGRRPSHRPTLSRVESWWCALAHFRVSHFKPVARAQHTARQPPRAQTHIPSMYTTVPSRASAIWHSCSSATTPPCAPISAWLAGLQYAMLPRAAAALRVTSGWGWLHSAIKRDTQLSTVPSLARLASLKSVASAQNTETHKHKHWSEGAWRATGVRAWSNGWLPPGSQL